MIDPSPTLDFCLQNLSLQWSDILWGIDKGIFTWRDVRNFALHRMSDPRSATFDIENSIVSLSKNNASEIMDLARDAALIEHLLDPEVEQARWLYLLLKWVFDNQDVFSYPLGVAEEIYGEFGCPSSMESFITFLPPKDGWDPSKHSRTENERKLLNNWAMYLQRSPFNPQTP